MTYRYIVGLIMALVPAAASAHVVVSPSSVGVAAYQTFSVGVPDEKDQAVTALRLVIPSGLGDVMPTVKPGWTIEAKKSGEVVTEVSWTGGQIPAGQRDEFSFSAQAPKAAGQLNWKAYQTYADGTVVSWDQAPKAGNDDESTTPYSVTKVVNDLSGSVAAKPDDTRANAALAISILALIAALTFRKRS